MRILVNGTRGKTTVTRLITAVLQESGLRTYGKSTGTQAAIIRPDGSETAYRKPHRMVNIREQIPFIRKAAADGAQAIVVECMALYPENQRMMAEELVRPTLVVVTNARVDHQLEIGRTEPETVATLALSVPRGATLVCSDARFDAYCSRRIAPLPDPEADALAATFPYEMFPENLSLALAVAKELGIPRETAISGLKKARPDAGMRGPFLIGDCLVVNGFAANDLTSSEQLLARAREKDGYAEAPVRLLFNNRADREFRLSAFLPMVRALGAEGSELRTMGDHAVKTARYFARRAGLPATPLAEPAENWIRSLSGEHCLVFCIGNIKGAGLRLTEILSETEGDAACSSKP